MNTDKLKDLIAELYKTAPDIHISISLSRPKLTVVNEPVRIVGVYAHIFMIEERSTGNPRMHSLSYTQLLTDKVRIAEIDATAGDLLQKNAKKC